MATTKIEDVDSLAPYLKPLLSLGYQNTDQIVGISRGALPALAKYLQTNDIDLSALIANLPQRAVPVALEVTSYHLGARLDRSPFKSSIVASVALRVESLPETVDLISTLRPVRHQMDRGTCVVHAASAVAEQYWSVHGRQIDLSRQFLYWNCKNNDGIPDEEGTWISVAMPLLVRDGCPLESVWPYNPNDIENDEGQGPPPDGAVEAALQYKVPKFEEIPPTSISDLKTALANGRVIAFSIPVFESWWRNTEVIRTGEIINPIPGEVASGAHAMCFVGYNDMPDDISQGGGRFILRNSWGTSWATESSVGHAGYGSIPYSYISRYGFEAFSI